jgi:putative ABC transport system permease protein
VEAVEGWAAASGSLVMPDGSDGESFTLLAPPAKSPLVKADMLEGVWVDEVTFPNAIAVNERFREVLPDLKVNDSLTIEINGAKNDVVVVGFFRLAGRSSGFMAYTTYEYLSAEIHQANLSRTYRVTGSIRNMTLEQQEALGREIEAHLEKYGITVSEVGAGHSLTATTADGLNVLTFFLLIMASLIAIVGSIGLMGTMSMNVLERTREIGVIRAIGASNWAVMNMVMVEGVLIGMMSWFFGTLLAFPISTLMSNAINLSLFGAAADFTFTPTGVVIWLAAVLVLSALASVLPARNAVRLTIREVLSYE